MKRVIKKILLLLLAIAVVGLAIWRPWHQATMQESLTVIPAKTGVTPPPGQDDVLAIVYSGDGGWRDLDKQLGGALSNHGIPVLGVSTLAYFWRNRPADESAADLDAVITQYRAQWGKQRVWLIGFSFGADVLPSVINKLSPENRAYLTQLVLLSPTKDVNFEIEMEGYMREGWWKTNTQEFFQRIHPVKHYDALPPLLALQGHPPVVCYYGKDEGDDTVCAEKSLPAWIQVVAKGGDHHFDGNYEALAKGMIADLPAAAAKP